MPSSDHIISFLLSVLLHLLGLLLIGSQIGRVNTPAETVPELEVSSIELTLAGPDPVAPAAPAEGPATLPAEEPLPPLDVPQPETPAPPPAMPEKPSFADALAPPPDAVTEPKPAPAPAATTTPRTAPPPSTPRPAGAAAENAVIQPANGGAYGRIDAHPSLHRPIKPNYPIGARRRGEEGTVILDVTVGEDGRATAVSTIASSGFPDLDRAAAQAAAQARFKPGARNGQPVAATARLTIIFRLRDQ